MPNSPQAQGVTAADIALVVLTRAEEQDYGCASAVAQWDRILTALRAGPQSGDDASVAYKAAWDAGFRAGQQSEEDEIAAEDRAAIEQIATECFAAGFDTPDGTAFGVVRKVIAAALSVPPERERRDTERLDWLEAQRPNVKVGDSMAVWGGNSVSIFAPFGKTLDQEPAIARADTFRAAIDAALSATPTEERNDG